MNKREIENKYNCSLKKKISTNGKNTLWEANCENYGENEYEKYFFISAQGRNLRELEKNIVIASKKHYGIHNIGDSEFDYED